MIKINVNSVQNNKISIPFSIKGEHQSIDTSEIANNQFLANETKKAINESIDYERAQFRPFNNIDEIIISIKEPGGAQTTYDYFGYTNNDIKFRRNRFTESFLRINFFDSPNPTNQKLAFNSTLYNQLNSDQRDGNGDLLDVSVMPITYRLVDPDIISGISEGFYIYWLKNPQENYPTKFYSYSSYNNAKDGISTQLMSYDAAVTIDTLNQYNYNTYNLIGVSNNFEYQVLTDDREIQMLSNKLYIDLYRYDIT